MHYYLAFNEKQSFIVEYESVSHSWKQIMATKKKKIEVLVLAKGVYNNKKNWLYVKFWIKKTKRK